MLVSVIMPTYNCAKFIAASVETVIAQTVTDWELLIVDDCSKDETAQVLAPYLTAFPNIRYHRLDQNSGPAVARSTAMAMAQGKYIAFLDSDDLWMPDKLEKQIRFMQDTGSSFSATAYRRMEEDSTLTDILRIPPPQVDYHGMLRWANPIGNSTVIYDREQLGQFQVPPIRNREDFALWLCILRKAHFCAGMAEELAMYRVRKNSFSSKKLQMAKYHWILYRQLEGLSLLKSVWAMACWVTVKLLRRDYVFSPLAPERKNNRTPQ